MTSTRGRPLYQLHSNGLGMLEKAMRHAAAIAASQDDDIPDPDDGGDDADVELAFEAERRKRLVEIAGRASNVSPRAARRARMIEVRARSA